jgi:hypothetical protein
LSAFQDLPEKYEIPDGNNCAIVNVHEEKRLFDFENAAITDTKGLLRNKISIL